jgi:hypothetical protein
MLMKMILVMPVSLSAAMISLSMMRNVTAPMMDHVQVSASLTAPVVVIPAKW